MKKRVKVIIGISTFCTVMGLFASLIYCALNAFPELLKNEIDNHPVAAKTIDVTTNNQTAKVENNNVTYVTNGNAKGFTPSNYSGHDIVVTHSSNNVKGNEKAIIEVASIKENVKPHKGKEHFSGFYEYRNDEVVVNKEKAEAINLNENESDNKILECTLLVLVIVQALGFVILNNKKPQLETFENRESHQ